MVYTLHYANQFFCDELKYNNIKTKNADNEVTCNFANSYIPYHLSNKTLLYILHSDQYIILQHIYAYIFPQT